MLFMLTGNRYIVRHHFATQLCRSYMFNLHSFRDIHSNPKIIYNGRQLWNYRVLCIDTMTPNEFEWMKGQGFREITVPEAIGGEQERQFYKVLQGIVHRQELEELNSY